ncbi:MAG: hypothetical protein QOG15_1632 [Solirubrobacteraceae bacterium]|jgi:hypothetical protein|nr:hypothetical protein [Solirubrobacteraceae bacterium]
MALDTVTLALEGDAVTLEQFARAVEGFAHLVRLLSNDAKAPGLGWEIADLEYSSAITTARVAALNGYEPGQVEHVVRAYLEIGQSLQRGHTIPYGEKIREQADAIVRVLDEGVRAVRFETAEADATIVVASDAGKTAALEPTSAYGAVTGRIQTLSSRSRLRFTLYDKRHDRPVSCYLVDGSEDLMRDAWDRMASVEGVVTRDAITGRPLSVRKIRNVELLHEGHPSDYRAARAAIPRRTDVPRAEVRIRRSRDAW